MPTIMELREMAISGHVPDGLSLIRDTRPLKLLDMKKGVLKEDSPTGRRGTPVMRVTGIFQKANEKNQNGRVYPKKVLENAVKSMQKAIKERRVMGEFDHPCRIDDDFRVLTVKGWKAFSDVTVGTVVFSRVDGHMVESKVTSVINEEYEGPVYSFVGRRIDDVFTGPHKIIMDVDRSGTMHQVIATARTIYEDRANFAGHSIPRSVEDGGDVESISLCPDAIQIEERQHKGRIYCLTTEHGSFYMEHKGHSYWTGNCDAKIHMDRVSHLMTKLWMEGDVVYGEAEVINDDRMPCGAMLECLLDRKIQVGVSSRGVGDMDLTVKEGDEVYEVQDGYAIVTFDAVAEPSVSTAQLSVMESLTRGTPHRDVKKITEEVLLRQFREMLAR